MVVNRLKLFRRVALKGTDPDIADLSVQHLSLGSRHFDVLPFHVQFQCVAVPLNRQLHRGTCFTSNFRQCSGIAQFCQIFALYLGENIALLHTGFFCRRICIDFLHLQIALVCLCHRYADSHGLTSFFCLISLIFLTGHVLGIRIVQTGNIAFHSPLHNGFVVHVGIIVLLYSCGKLPELPVLRVAGVVPINAQSCSYGKHTAKTEQQDQCRFPHRHCFFLWHIRLHCI